MGRLLPAMTQQKLDTQRDVVKNERRWSVDNQPYGTWWEKLPALAFPPDHPFHHSLIGSFADLEAASLDGASGWTLFRHIRFPLITPTFFFVVVSTTIFITEDVFDAISILTQGGPYGRTTNILYYLYQEGFQFFDVGEASATALLIFFSVVGVTWLQFRFAERHVHYV